MAEVMIKPGGYGAALVIVLAGECIIEKYETDDKVSSRRRWPTTHTQHRPRHGKSAAAATTHDAHGR